MTEIDYEIGANEAELRRLFAAEVDPKELVDAHDEPWLSCGLEPPLRTVKRLRAEALASFLEHASQPPAEHVLTLKEAAPLLDTTERSLRHDVDQGRYDEWLTETSGGLRALRFEDTARTWSVPRRRRPDPRVVVLMKQRGVEPGEEFAHYRRRRDGTAWDRRW